tara:strand:- start:582 stop:800 length:219 start_codon:yes stop_codon:yes gene_type:complete
VKSELIDFAILRRLFSFLELKFRDSIKNPINRKTMPTIKGRITILLRINNPIKKSPLGINMVYESTYLGLGE